MFRKKHKALIAFLTVVLLGWAINSHAQPNRPVIVDVFLTNPIQPGQTERGILTYENAQEGVEAVFFKVVDGRYRPQTVAVNAAAEQGQVFFELECTEFAQQITLSVSMQDQGGRLSDPKLIVFQCGQPNLYNFSVEQTRARPVADVLKVNFFILDDGVTELANAATPTQNPLWSEPSALVRASISDVIAPALTNIWDQCGLAFEANHIKVIHPRHLDAGGGNLYDALFITRAPTPVIDHGNRASALFDRAHTALIDALRDSGEPATLDQLSVFITGAPIRSVETGKETYIEGFGQLSSLALGGQLIQPRYTVVRWGSLFEQNGAVVEPRQVISTMAHELGHNLGLRHPHETNVAQIENDDDNLMKGSGVTPEPRSNLLTAQCNEFRQTLTEIRRQFRAWSLTASLRANAPYLHFPVPQQADLVRGFMEMRNAVRLSLKNNSVLSWVLKIATEERHFGANGAKSGIADVMVRPDGGQYTSLLNDNITLFAGSNGEFQFNMDLKLVLGERFEADDYHMTLGYTVHSL